MSRNEETTAYTPAILSIYVDKYVAFWAQPDGIFTQTTKLLPSLLFIYNFGYPLSQMFLEGRFFYFYPLIFFIYLNE